MMARGLFSAMGRGVSGRGGGAVERRERVNRLPALARQGELARAARRTRAPTAESPFVDGRAQAFIPLRGFKKGAEEGHSVFSSAIFLPAGVWGGVFTAEGSAPQGIFSRRRFGLGLGPGRRF